jgi:multicomponent Na+:H+ antiporter subunit C
MDRLLIILLFCAGLWGIVSGRNLIRKIIALSLLNSSVVLLFVLSGRIGTAAPILTGGAAGPLVDPLPQALMLTAIVVGLSITAVALVLAVRLYRECGSLDVEEIEKRSGDDER